MARRKQHSLIEPSSILSLLAVVGLIWLNGQFLQDTPHGSNLVSSLIILGAFAAGAAYPSVARFLQRTAASRRAQSAPSPASGQPRPGPLRQPISAPPSQPASANVVQLRQPTVGGAPALLTAAPIDDAAVDDRLPLQTFSSGMSPAAFASYCTRQLLRAGWNSCVALQRQDARADLVAERDGQRVALQCAIDSNAVGFRAVQQAAAARADANAGIAAVVSGSGYTAAAQHFAAANDILLLHYRDLPKLDRILAGGRRVTAAPE